MYVARESSAKEAEEDQRHPPAVPREDASKGEEHLAAVHNDSEEGPLSEYGSALSGGEPYGSQYSSEGEMYNLDLEVFTVPHLIRADSAWTPRTARTVLGLY